jgi:hypothetical protein
MNSQLVICTGAEFNDKFPGAQWIKLTKKYDNNGLKLSEGFVKDIHPLVTEKMCTRGGIHFTNRQNAHRFAYGLKDYTEELMHFISVATIPSDSTICYDTVNSMFKVDGLNIGKKELLWMTDIGMEIIDRITTTKGFEFLIDVMRQVISHGDSGDEAIAFYDKLIVQSKYVKQNLLNTEFKTRLLNYFRFYASDRFFEKAAMYFVTLGAPLYLESDELFYNGYCSAYHMIDCSFRNNFGLGIEPSTKVIIDYYENFISKYVYACNNVGLLNKLMIRSAKMGRVDAVKYFIKEGAMINADEDKVLWLGVEMKNKEMVRLALKSASVSDLSNQLRWCRDKNATDEIKQILREKITPQLTKKRRSKKQKTMD